MWKYEGKEVKSIDDLPEGTTGFVYMIINLTKYQMDNQPWFYIGKKNVYSNITKKLGKKELAALDDKRKSKKKKITKESDWMNYTGSNKSLNQDISNGDDISKVILHVCPNSTCLTYMETKTLFEKGVLENPDYYNDNILGRFFRGNIGK